MEDSACLSDAVTVRRIQRTDPVNFTDREGLQLDICADPGEAASNVYCIERKKNASVEITVSSQLFPIFNGESLGHLWIGWFTPSSTTTSGGVGGSTDGGPPEPVLPKEVCDPDVIAAMKKAWTQSANGKSGVEAGFRLDGNTDAYTIVESRFTNQRMRQTMSIKPGVTFDVFHVHPDSGDPKPSPGDQDLGKKYGIVMFTMSASGLYEYDPTTDKTTKLRNGLDWTKPCPE